MRRIPFQFCGRALRVLVPETEHEKKVGLLEHAGLGDDEGMLLTNVSGLHTMGMLFVIDVAWLNPDGTIELVCANVPPGVQLPATTGRALEVAGGWFERLSRARETA